MFEMKLTDPGEGLLEAEITQWLVAPGDEVAVNQVVVEVETAKSLVELPAAVAGVVGELRYAEGDIVEVGSVIMTIDDGTPEPSAPETQALDAENSSPRRPGQGAVQAQRCLGLARARQQAQEQPRRAGAQGRPVDHLRELLEPAVDQLGDPRIVRGRQVGQRDEVGEQGGEVVDEVSRADRLDVDHRDSSPVDGEDVGLVEVTMGGHDRPRDRIGVGRDQPLPQGGDLVGTPRQLHRRRLQRQSQADDVVAPRRQPAHPAG